MLQLFTLKNLITQLHGSPMAFHNLDHAKHEIKKFLEAEQLKEETNPSDFELHYSGDYCNETGIIFTSDDVHDQLNEFICNCSELILKESK